MPLYSDHISNMYYSGSSSYSAPYSYGSKTPFGTSYSASYLNPGSSYSNHSSLGGYTRAPVTSRWVTSSGRTYSPMLSTISERTTSSPSRISSPRRIASFKRNYVSSSYTPRPININTADIDVSRNKYRPKAESPPPPPPEIVASTDNENGPFMPRVDGKPETGIDSSPGELRSTIKRGRTVVRLHTIKRKDRDSPRKPLDRSQKSSSEEGDKKDSIEYNTANQEATESKGWREKLSEDLIYKDKKEKKTIGAKLMEKFIVKDNNDDDIEMAGDIKNKQEHDIIDIALTAPPTPQYSTSRSPTRRCSIEILAEQANLLDSLIRSENLSTLDLSKIGVTDEPTANKKINNQPTKNPLKTTKSDNTLNDRFRKSQEFKEPKHSTKRRSLKRSSSGGRLDSITEFPKEAMCSGLPSIEESSRSSIKHENTKPKPKLKAKITATVEVSPPTSPLKFKVEEVTVEEKPRVLKKEISYTSSVDAHFDETPKLANRSITNALRKSKMRSIRKKTDVEDNVPSPEPDDGNFWDKIGKRETIYLIKRKQDIEDTRERHRRALYWYPEDEGSSANEDVFEEATEMDLKVSNNEKTLEDNIKHIEDKKQDTDIITNVTDTKITESSTKAKVLSVSISNKMPVETLQQTSSKTKDDIQQHLQVENEKENLSDSASRAIRKDAASLPSITNPKTSDNNEVIETMISKLDIKEELNTASKNETKGSNFNKIIGADQKSNGAVKNDPVPEESRKPELFQTSNNKSSPKSEEKSSTIKTDLVPEESCKLLGLQTTNNKSSPESGETITNTDNKNPVPEESSKPHLPLTSSTKSSPKSEEKTSTIKKDLEPEESKSQGLQTSDNKSSPMSAEKYNTAKRDQVEDSSKPQRLQTNNKGSPKNDQIIEESKPERPQMGNNKDKDFTEKNSANTQLLTTDDKPISTLQTIKVVTNKTTENPANTAIQDKNKPKPIKQEPPKQIKTEENTFSVKNMPPQIETSKLKKHESPKTTKAEDKICPIHGKKDNKLLETETKSELSKLSSIDDVSIPRNADTKFKISLEATEQKVEIINDNLVTSTPSEAKQLVNEPETIVESVNIPKDETAVKNEEQKTRESNKAENKSINKEKDDTDQSPAKDIIALPKPVVKKPVKQELAVRPLIATPRPLQKKSPQVIHSSSSSESSSEEDTSDDEDADESDTSEESAEFFECENNADGRTSTGSNDSGFDSSAPTSPAGFVHIKKGAGGESPGPGTSAAAAPNTPDFLDKELEQSTAYGLFRKTGRFTPPARTIPRFRKYNIEDFHFVKVLGKGSFGKVQCDYHEQKCRGSYLDQQHMCFLLNPHHLALQCKLI